MVTSLGLVRPDPVLQPLSTQSDRIYVEAFIAAGHREPDSQTHLLKIGALAS
jgi:hypothetical protein